MSAMSGVEAEAEGYVVPTYEAAPGAAYYHFLHGNVPGHQIDFIYRPEVPSGPLSRQHFSHLSRLVRYLEPREDALCAFAIGNLSRDDTQHEPGRGGLALILGLRVEGALDHAGRQDPPFTHAVVAVDRAVSRGELLALALALHRRVVDEGMGGAWYRRYTGGGHVQSAFDPFGEYVAFFDDLPALSPRSPLGGFTMAGALAPERVLIVHEDGAPFEEIADCAVKIAAVLYRSDIRWTTITNGRDEDIPNGVSIRFVPQSEAVAVGPGEAMFALEAVPDDEVALASQLFGARVMEVPSRRGAVVRSAKKARRNEVTCSIDVDLSSMQEKEIEGEKEGAEAPEVSEVWRDVGGAGERGAYAVMAPAGSGPTEVLVSSYEQPAEPSSAKWWLLGLGLVGVAAALMLGVVEAEDGKAPASPPVRGESVFQQERTIGPSRPAPVETHAVEVGTVSPPPLASMPPAPKKTAGQSAESKSSPSATRTGGKSVKKPASSREPQKEGTILNGPPQFGPSAKSNSER